ncbi:MAG: SDR family oxidoreductase [Acidobacteriota bacterium]
MKILVTGHDGYIGAVLVPLFRSRGHEIVGLDCELFGGCNFGPDESDDSVEVLKRDLRELRRGDIATFDAVVHLAALSNDPLGNLDAGLTHSINYEASLHLAELAKEAGCPRFLFSSSCSTYGAAGEAMLDEAAEFNPVTPYAVEKVRLEQALAGLADDDFSPVYLRNATAYGLSPKLRIDLVLNNLVGWATTTGKIKLLSDGSPWRPIVHAEDISRAFLAAAEAPREAVHDEAFNVGRTEHNHRVRDIAEIVAGAVPGAELEMAPEAGPDKRSYRVDFTKIETRLPGFEPQWDPRRSAERLHAAFRDVGLTAADMEGPSFIRLKRLEELIAAGRLGRDLRWRTA